MKNNFKSSFFTLLMIVGTATANAQCPGGQVELRLDVTTDDYGYETYWEIVPQGNACGTGTIGSGGSTVVGCNGGGAQVQNQSAGYGNNTTYNEGPWCVTAGACFDLKVVDDWGDGGGDFDVIVGGFSVGTYNLATGSNGTYTFCANLPPAFDLGMNAMSRPYIYDNAGMKDVIGNIYNFGTTTITTMDVNYKIDNNPTQTSNLTGLNIANAQGYDFTHPTQWNATSGTHTIKVWASNLNGNPDMNNNNDTITRVLQIGSGIPNVIDNYLSATVTNIQIGNASDQLDKPTDLDFHPQLSNRQLWVINERLEGNGGSTVIYNDAGLPTQTDQQKVDGNAWHFMSLPTGLAFGKNGNWASSPGVYDANHNGGAPFTGPTLWSGNLAIYAQPSGGNGSHLDMLHVSPYSRGIAYEEDNVYWVFDGNSNDLVRYDFVDDHGPGNSFHGDAKIYRYNDVAVAKDPNNKVVCHMVVENGWLYVVDYGNQKVFRLQLGTGTIGSVPAFGPFESVAAYNYVTGYTMQDVVTTGLVEPAGIDIVGNRMIVSDYSTNQVIIYDITNMPATELGRVNTSASGIMGVKIGPDGQIWYVDYDANTVNLLDIGLTPTAVNDVISTTNISVYPNPTKDNFSINFKGVFTETTNVNVFDLTGKLIYTGKMNSNNHIVNVEDWANGIYYVHLSGETQFTTQKVVVQH